MLFTGPHSRMNLARVEKNIHRFQTTSPSWPLIAQMDLARAQLQKDGGDIELIDVEGNKVKVKLTGMCSGCKNAAMTLKAFVESVLKDKVDSSLEVEQV